MTSQGYDSWGYPRGCLPTLGCEQGNYGNFIDSVRDTNLRALRILVAPQCAKGLRSCSSPTKITDRDGVNISDPAHTSCKTLDE